MSYLPNSSSSGEIPRDYLDYKGFFRSLYDFKFNSLITTKIIKVLYALVTVLYSIGALAFFVILLSKGGVDIIVGIIVIPLLYIIYLAFARVSFEILIVLFRIAEDVRRIANRPPSRTE
ncbi:MAG: DUF4282 domain-containing protein [Firmicutes bacterium]|nr:DUF4282 domain-containing protein [Bacillota bacterium]